VILNNKNKECFRLWQKLKILKENPNNLMGVMPERT
jgi:hypothetical protein